MGSFRVICLVDNTVQLSSGLWGEHGVSFLIETDSQQVLFDTGDSGDVLAHNLRVMGLGLEKVRTVVLSHGHQDHTGGLPWVLEHSSHPVVVADPQAFEPKYSLRGDHLAQISLPLSPARIEAQAQLVLTAQPYPILPDLVVSGRIPRTNTFEAGSSRLMTEVDGVRVRDEMPDDRSLFLDTPQGLVLVLGCCHSGLINTLTLAQEMFARPIRAVIGGTHLNSASAQQMAETLRWVREEFKVEALYLNHCTGPNGFRAFDRALGDCVHPCPAGTLLDF